jgi:hypothetical protein
MTEREGATPSTAPPTEVPAAKPELDLRLSQLEEQYKTLAQDFKTLRSLLERIAEHRQKSHNELVLLLTGLVGKLPINDVGVVVAKLVEHNTNVSQYLAALLKGTAEAEMPKPQVLVTLDQAKRNLTAALKPAVEELLRLDTPFEKELLQSLVAQPENFFSPRMVRANRCFIKGQVPRERVVREFGEAALGFFQDVTTDPKLNPRPKAEEIALAFKPDFETLMQQNGAALPQKRDELLALYQKVQRSKASTEEARAQRIAFQKLSYLIELLHYYGHQNTESPDVIFAQRLPALIEQLVLSGSQETIEERLLVQAETLLGYVISPEHRQMLINNLGKTGGPAKTLKYVLRLRAENPPDADNLIAEFIKHLLPSPKVPPAADLVPILRLIHPQMQRSVLKAIISCERLRKADAEALGKALGDALGIARVLEEVKAQPALPPEVERQMAWAKIKELIVLRNDPTAIAAAIRERLNAKYDSDEIRQSWITLIEAEPLSLIRIFCQIPYRGDGKTDSIARPVLETYVTRLMHEKYAATYKKIVNSLRNLHAAKPDSPTLVNFLALVRWVDAEAANRIAHDIGMAMAAH